MRHYYAVRLIGLVLILASGMISNPAQSAGPDADQPVVSAHEAWKHQDRNTLDRIAAQYQGVLADYPQYWSLELALDLDPIPPNDAIGRFLKRYPDRILAKPLRIQWLKVLAKRQDWDLFEGSLTPEAKTNLSVNCADLEARLLRQDPKVAEEARHLWQQNRDWPDQCDPLWRWMAGSKNLTTDDLWVALEQDLLHGHQRQARYVNSFFPPFDGLDVDDLSLATGRPRQYLDSLSFSSPPSRSQRVLMHYALLRLAHNAPPEAAQFWADNAIGLPPDEQGLGWNLIGWQAALAQLPQALDWGLQTHQPLTDDTFKVWRIRAALRQDNWREVLDTIDSLTSTLARQPAWIYWKAEALKELQQPALARGLLEALSHEPDYYGLLALEELGGAATLDPTPSPPTEADVRLVRTQLDRAVRLFQLGLVREGRNEWIQIEPGLNPTQHLAASRLANALGWYDRSIHAVEHAGPSTDDSLLFPLPFQEALTQDASKFALDPAWLYAVIRQESRFYVEAVSSAGAQGLMQLMPATARWSARQLGLPPPRSGEESQTELNLQLGSFYLRHLQDLLGNPILATAGYNAGPLRAQTWAQHPAPRAAIFVENIPFEETRDYVQAVLYNRTYYALRLHLPPQPLHRQLEGLEQITAPPAPSPPP